MSRALTRGIGYASNNVTYYTDYIKSDIAVNCLRIPTQQEVEIIGYGIDLARHLSNIPSLEKSYPTLGTSNLTEHHLFASSFRKDTTIPLVDITFYSTFTQNYKDAWHLIYGSLVNRICGHLQTIAQQAEHAISAIIRSGINNAGYFKSFNIEQLITEVKHRSKTWPDQPIYVYMSNINYQYIQSYYASLMGDWSKNNIFILQRRYNSLNTNIAGSLYNQVFGLAKEQDVAYLNQSIDEKYSAVIAAGQVRINNIYQDEKNVTPYHLMAGAVQNGFTLTYKLKQELGIRIAPYEAIEDPNDSYRLAMGHQKDGRFNLIED